MIPIHFFTDGRPPADVKRAVGRMSAWPDVFYVAVMPDAHLGGEACVGVVLATRETLFPQAVGSDIGCGMTSVCLGPPAEPPTETALRELLSRIQRRVPIHRHRTRQELPGRNSLSDARLARIAAREGAIQFATLGRGNHFLELQADLQGQYWLTAHSGSRAVGAAVYEWHTRSPEFIQAGTDRGRAYLADVTWCRCYAAQSRRAMLTAAIAEATELLGLSPTAEPIDCDHNHVAIETIDGQPAFIHRKGATPAYADQPGIIAGSMGTRTFITLGRGHAEALHSSSHGAGRRLSRTEARRRISRSELRRLMRGVLYDPLIEHALLEESPSAYRDIRRVMRAQHELTRITTELRPVLIHKGA